MNALTPPANEAHWSLGLAAGIQLAGLFWLPELARWRGPGRAILQLWGAGGGAVVCLVLTVPRLIRVQGTLRLWAGLLSLLPLLVLHCWCFWVSSSRSFDWEAVEDWNPNKRPGPETHGCQQVEGRNDNLLSHMRQKVVIPDAGRTVPVAGLLVP